MKSAVFPTQPSHADSAARIPASPTGLARRLILLGAAALAATATSPAAVTDLGGNLTQVLDSAIGAGNTGRLTANTQSHWAGTNSSSSVDLNGFQFTINTGGGNAQTYNGAFTGPGTLRFQGRGDATWEPDMRLGGAAANTPTGAILNYGRVQLNKTAGVDALAGPITVDTNQTVRLQLLASNQLNDASTITSTAGSGAFHLDLGGFSETISGLEMKTGHFVNTGVGGVLKVTTLTVGGVVQPKGAYTVSSGFVTGTGYIDVDNFGPPVIVNPPGVPAGPTPADAASTVHPAFLAKLTWSTALEATSYDVYLWLASETKPVTPTANVALPEFSVSPQLLSLSNYKWQVVAKNGVGDTAGPEWTFTTVDRRDISGNLPQTLDAIVGAGPARLVGDAQSYWAGTTAAAGVNLNGFQFTINTGGGNAQTYNGALTGPGTLRFQGRGDASWEPDMRLGGTAANSPAGVTIDYGRVQLNKTAGVDALAGPIMVTTNQTVRIQLLASNQLNDASTIDSTSSSGAFHLMMGGFNDTVAGLTINTGHTVDTEAGGVLTVTSLVVGGATLTGGPYTSGNSTFVTGSGSVVVRNPPTFAGFTASTPFETPASISLGKLLDKASDPDGDDISVTAAGPGSAQGGTAVLQANAILYTPPNGFSGEDTFTITITDAGGASVSGTVTVTVVGNSGVGANSPLLTALPGGDMKVDFQGIPARSYEVQRSTNLNNWTVLATIVAGPTGAVSYTDENPPEGSAFYRLRKP